jgi:hypothetical protein
VNNISSGDEIRGGRGNDRFEIATSDFVLVDGQAGSDTLVLRSAIDYKPPSLLGGFFAAA